jgi:hypothetical protein
VEKARVSAALALEQAKAGRNAEALRMAGESLRAARLIPDHQEKTSALWRVAGMFKNNRPISADLMRTP